jgi:hypothetical protein
MFLDKWGHHNCGTKSQKFSPKKIFKKLPMQGVQYFTGENLKSDLAKVSTLG